MSKAVTQANKAMEEKALKRLDTDFFLCTAKQAPECTGRGFLVGREQSTCSSCLNWQKWQKPVEVKEKYAYWFLMEDSK